MKQRLADYVADFLVAHGVTDCFSVVGGGAMHLNDALGHKEGLQVTYRRVRLRQKHMHVWITRSQPFVLLPDRAEPMH